MLKRYIFILLLLIYLIIHNFKNKVNIEKEIIKKLSYINKNFYDNKGSIKRETSFKISDNKINDKRFVYLLNVTTLSHKLNKSLFNKMLNYLDISKPYLSYFPNTDFKNIGEIILGIDGHTKKNKIYFTIVKEHSYINALECLNKKCEIKKYEQFKSINLNKLSNLHPNAKEIYNRFHDSHTWEITKNNGDLSIHIALDKYNDDLFLFKKYSKLFRKWTKHLLTNKEWDKLVKKYGNHCLYLLGISKKSMTFYIRLPKN